MPLSDTDRQSIMLDLPRPVLVFILRDCRGETPTKAIHRDHLAQRVADAVESGELDMSVVTLACAYVDKLRESAFAKLSPGERIALGFEA